MKQLVILISLALSLVSCASCSKNTATAESTINTNAIGIKMKIRIGNNIFTATLYDNKAALALKSLLPLTENAIELNGNEKYVDLPRSLPANASNPGTIQNGDLMLYGSSTLVLFYKSFSTSYSYTRIGRIDDTTGLSATLGAGNVDITFESE